MGRPELPEGLYISVSQLKCYLRCPRQFELKYVRGVPPAFMPVALAFGSAFHEALAAYYRELKLTGAPLGRELVLDVFKAAWEKGTSGPVPLQGDEDEDLNVGHLTDKGVAMLHVFYEHASARTPGVEIQDVEKSFAVHIHDPDTGTVLEEQLVGTVDLITKEHDRRVVVEHKSSSKKYTADQLRFDIQPTAYKLAAREVGMGEVGLRFQIMTKAKTPAIQIADIERNELDERDFLRIVVGVLRAIDAEAFYPLRGWQCRTCPYQEPCAVKTMRRAPVRLRAPLVLLKGGPGGAA